MQQSSLVVVGGGPAGREAARCASRYGMDVILVTPNLSPNHRLDSTSIRYLAEEAERMAVPSFPEGSIPGPQMAPVLRETLIGAMKISGRNHLGAFEDLKAVGVQIIEGYARLIGPDAVKVYLNDGGVREIVCASIILATGVEAFGGFTGKATLLMSPPAMPHIRDVPRRMVIIGSSCSALEMARFFSSYGIDVTVVGGRWPALNFLDSEVRRRAAETTLARHSIRIVTELTVVSCSSDHVVEVFLSDGSHITAECIMPCGEGNYRTSDLGLDVPGVMTGPDGVILTDKSMRTNLPKIFAVGGVTGGYFPSAIRSQARVAACTASGGEAVFRTNLIAHTVWFNPQIGSVGLTEDEASKRGISVNVSEVYISPESGPERFVKLIADGTTGRMLGAQLLGVGAIEAAHMAALSISEGSTITDIADLSCTEGTMTECIASAASLAGHPFAETNHPIVGSP